MYIRTVQIAGVRDAGDYASGSWERVQDLPPAPRGVRVADALSLFVGALSPADFGHTLAMLELGSEALATTEDADGFPDQATELRPSAVRALLDDDAQRHLTIDVGLALDPPLFGTLREHALRDPRLVNALGGDALLHIKVGWLFTRDYTAVDVSVLGVRMGDVSFPTIGADRPAWLPALLRDAGRRVARPDWLGPERALAQRCVDAGMAADAGKRATWAAAAAALEAPPFSLGPAALALDGGRPRVLFGPGLHPPRQLGRPALDALRLVATACIEAPDVLVLDLPLGDVHRAWIADRIEGDDATLEQVLLTPRSPP